MPDRRSWWHDENGKFSMARALLATWTVGIFLIITIDITMVITTWQLNAQGEPVSMRIPGEVYILFGAILPLLILWAAGRHLKHVAPYIGGVVGGITRGIARLGERVGGPSPGYTLPPDFQADNERTEPEPEE